MIEHCGPDTIICTCQNGIPELAVAKYYPEDKIMGCTVGWPATFLRPGVSALTCKPDEPEFEFHLGRVTGVIDDKVREVQAVLDKMCTGRVHLTENLIADRWSKVMINAAFSGMSTVVNGTFGEAISGEKSGLCAARIPEKHPCFRTWKRAKSVKSASSMGWYQKQEEKLAWRRPTAMRLLTLSAGLKQGNCRCRTMLI
jgi:ketopantoate reductase